jgi:CBS domain-containing membrane protein
MNYRIKPTIVDYKNALNSMETFQDITVDSVMKIVELAEQHATRRTTESIQASKVMSSPVITVTKETAMSDAAHSLVTNRISGLPVVDKDNVLQGILTEADFLSALGIPVQHPHYSVWQTLETMISHVSNVSLMNMEDGVVADYMTSNVITSMPEQDIHHIVESMKQHKVKRIVINNEQHQVVGMVTRSNLVKLFFDQYMDTQSVS